MASIEHILYEIVGRPDSVVAYLDASAYDELIEMDLVNNRFVNRAHVEGKFFVPIFEGDFEELFKYSGGNMVHPDDQAIHDALMDRTTIFERLAASETPGVISAEIRYRLKDGGYHWTRELIVGGEEHGVAAGTIRVYIYDIQAMKERELGSWKARNLQSGEIRDELTGIRRERDFISAMRSRRDDSSLSNWCMAVMDIDQFKLFNDWYGRKAGDFVLAKIGAYLAQHEVADKWVAGYLGQDDFCVFMPHDEDAIQSLFEDVSAIIAGYGASMTFYPAIGVCRADRSIPVLDLMDRAKLATEAAKSDFRHHIRHYQHEMRERTEAEYRLLTDFEHAMANGEICFAVQPQCRIATGQIVGVEALARWRKPDGNVIQPGEFIPVLEKSGFICYLDRYIWNDVCRRVKRWVEDGNRPVPVSVNVSRQDIYEFDVAEHFENLLRTYGLDPSLIKIEITESAYIDDENKVGEAVRRLREKGFVVLMDDFGSGYSSLNTLDSLNIDVIKLDMAFMRMSDESKRKSVRIVESMVNMAKTLDLGVIAEGVEEREQAEFLQSIGCHHAQGFYFYKPMYPEEFERLISNGEGAIDASGLTFKRNEEFHLREFLDQNVYSDAMLNSIVGPLAIYSWHGQDVDIIRFNEQFFEEIGVETLQDHLKRNQTYVDPKDVVRFYALLCDAMEDELNGATDVIRYRRLDGSPFDILLHFFYLGEVEESKRFYVSARNVTQLTEYREQQHLLSLVAKVSVTYLRRQSDGWHFNIGLYGIEDILGLSHEEVQRELLDRSFLKRLDPEVAKSLTEMLADDHGPEDDFSMPLDIKLDNGETAHMDLTCCRVKDARATFSYVLIVK